MNAPYGKTCVGGANDCTHAFGLGLKFSMTEQTARKNGRFMFINSQADQAIPFMA